MAGLFAPIIAIFLIVQLITGIQARHIDKDSPANSNEAVLARIAPVGEVKLIDANAPRVEKEGEVVFNEVCASCHTSGALGAPKYGNKGEWSARIGQGYDTLIKHAIEGIRQMPARGGNPDLSDVEIARAVAYMANAAGAKFTPPAAATAPATATAAAPAGAGATPATTAAVDGKKVYDAACVACHSTGVAGAPKAGDKAAWAPRIKAGKDVLYASALHGKNAMPAKGGNPALSEAEVKAAVDYLVGLAK